MDAAHRLIVAVLTAVCGLVLVFTDALPAEALWGYLLGVGGGVPLGVSAARSSTAARGNG